MRSSLFKQPSSRFFSNFIKKDITSFPAFTNTRIMMMPIVIGDLKSIPPALAHYHSMIKSVFTVSPENYKNQVGYLTIDESDIEKGSTHRRPGLHVDGLYRGGVGGWGGAAPWAGSEDGILKTLQSSIDSENLYHYGPGMFLIASHSGCVAWRQEFEGMPGSNGECEHLASQCKDENKEVLQPNHIYWLNPLCVHAATSMPENTRRQLVRVSMPSKAPWFSEYTPNPLGLQPAGPIIHSAERVEFMNFRPTR